LLVGALASTAHTGAQDFTYSGPNGPPHWGSLNPAFAACSQGEQQSPVQFGRLARKALRRFLLPIDTVETHGAIFNNGHTIEVEAEGGNFIEVDGEPFELVQFHFHSPSEHTVRGRGYDMELHLVHRNAESELAVVGVLLRRGGSSGALAPIFESLPEDVDVHHALEHTFDPGSFLPASRRHYRYDGSLTTPPCTEGVRWLVLFDSLTVSDEHLARFDELIRFNARPVQRATR
jgi:carbonic anhydrase